MARTKTRGQLTPLELELMKVLWELGSANVQSVQRALAPKKKLAYTTVQTMLNLLHRKRKVKRTLKNRAYFYSPRVSRSQASGQALGDIIDRFFGGSAENLVLSLVENRHLTPEELDKLRQLVDSSGRVES